MASEIRVNTINNRSGLGTVSITDTGLVVSGIITATSIDTSSTSAFSSDVSIADKIIHTGDTNTAIRFPANDQISFEVGGVERLRVHSNNYVGINSSIPLRPLDLTAPLGVNIPLVITSGSNQTNGFIAIKDPNTSGNFNNRIGCEGDNLLFWTGGGEALRITSGGNVGIGSTQPSARLDVNGVLSCGPGVAPFISAKFRDYNDGSAIYASVVQAGGGKFISGESYYFNSGFWRSDKTTSTAIGLDSGNIRFLTRSGLTANANFNGPYERMVVRDDGTVSISDGNLRFSTSGTGIDFSATSDAGGMTSELLDDYEEGTFDPTVSMTISGSLTLNSSYNSLSYTKIGRLVTISGQIRIDTVSSPVGNILITNIPYTVRSTTELGRAGGGLYYFDNSAGVGNYYKPVSWAVVESSSTLYIYTQHSGGGITPGTADEISFSCTYVAA